MRSILFSFLTASSLIISGCGGKKVSPQDDNTTEFDGVPKNAADLSEKLLLIDPEYALDNQPSALRANYSADSKIPLRTQPKQAEMVIAPHKTADGAYHGYSSVWIIVEEGEWSLSHAQKDASGGKITITPIIEK
jgi:hypothetical protein